MKHEVTGSLVEIAIDSAAGIGRAEFRFEARLAVFEGHFPDLAIVPGVYLIEASRLLAERIAGTPLRIHEIHTARFTGEVHPGTSVKGEATLHRDGDAWVCDATFETAADKVAKVRLGLRIAAG